MTKFLINTFKVAVNMYYFCIRQYVSKLLNILEPTGPFYTWLLWTLIDIIKMLVINDLQSTNNKQQRTSWHKKFNCQYSDKRTTVYLQMNGELGLYGIKQQVM